MWLLKSDLESHSHILLKFDRGQIFTVIGCHSYVCINTDKDHSAVHGFPYYFSDYMYVLNGKRLYNSKT